MSGLYKHHLQVNNKESKKKPSLKQSVTDLHRHFTKADIQMTKKDMKRLLAMQI